MERSSNRHWSLLPDEAELQISIIDEVAAACATCAQQANVIGVVDTTADDRRQQFDAA